MSATTALTLRVSLLVLAKYPRYNSCYEVVLALLRRGAKINARESAGEYPIHVAALYSADRVVDLLLR